MAPDWPRRIDPAELGRAIVAADTAAATHLGQAIAARLAADDPVPSAGTAPSATPSSPEPRPLPELAEQVLAAFDQIGQRIGRPRQPAIGEAGEGGVRMSITFNRITDCVIDPRWLARQDHQGITAALGQALTAARTAQAKAGEPAAQLSRQMAELLGEVKSTLRDLGERG